MICFFCVIVFVRLEGGEVEWGLGAGRVDGWKGGREEEGWWEEGY